LKINIKYKDGRSNTPVNTSGTFFFPFSFRDPSFFGISKHLTVQRTTNKDGVLSSRRIDDVHFDVCKRTTLSIKLIIY